ncbi:B12-binding domain-containing radical SAM protein [Elusimicrobiota bacterium]
MKILLIKPGVTSDSIIPPVGLGYIAGAVSGSHQVKILDCLKDKIGLKKLDRIIKDYDPGLVGVQVFNIDKKMTTKYLKAVKEINKDIITIVGGPYPSCEPEEVFNYFSQDLDYAFAGEAEKGFKKLLGKIENKESNDSFHDVEGLIWKDDDKTVANNPVCIEDLDEIGIPSWEHLKPETYPPVPAGGFLKNYPVAPINISRGCPFRCSFCAGWRITGDRVRYRSVDNVIEEIEVLYHKHGIREIHIIDDNFTYSREYVMNFCKALIEKEFNISSACPNGIRLDTLDSELLELMKEAGFYIFNVGIESGTPETLTYMKKNLTVEIMKEKIDLIKKAGLKICGYFILGYPGETTADLKRTLKFAMELPLTRAMFMNFLPIPGTLIFESLKNSAEIVEKDLDNKTFYNVSYKNPEISPLRLKYFQIKAFLLFYLRPKILFENISDIYNFRHLLSLVKRVFRMLVNV